jgi:hypothetical protein
MYRYIYTYVHTTYIHMYIFINLHIQVSNPEEEIIAEEKIKIVDTQKIKNIPKTIEDHGVHEMCFRYEGHNGILMCIYIDLYISILCIYIDLHVSILVYDM